VIDIISIPSGSWKREGFSKCPECHKDTCDTLRYYSDPDYHKMLYILLKCPCGYVDSRDSEGRYISAFELPKE